MVPHLSLNFLSGWHGFRMSYFLFYFWLPQIALLKVNRSSSRFLTDRNRLKEEKKSPASRSIYFVVLGRFMAGNIFLYFLFSFIVVFRAHRGGSSTNLDLFTSLSTPPPTLRNGAQQQKRMQGWEKKKKMKKKKEDIFSPRRS